MKDSIQQPMLVTDPCRLGKCLQVMNLGHGLLVMIGGRKLPENKGKAADMRSCECVGRKETEAPL